MIVDRHQRTGHESPTSHEIVRSTLAGIRRDYAAAGDRPRNPRALLLTADVTTIVTAARDHAAGWAREVLERRDSALILIGYAGAFRRIELVELQWAQAVPAFDTGGRVGVIRTLMRSRPVDAHVCRGAIPRTSVRALLFRSIRKNGNLSDTPLSGAAVHAAIRRRATLAGYYPAVITQLGRRAGPSHAVGHDAGIMSAKVPTAMVFVRNPTGVTHSPNEFAEPADCNVGATALDASESAVPAVDKRSLSRFV